MKEITIDIETDGQVKVEGHGFRGNECTKLTADLEEALGAVESKTFKPEHRLMQAVLRKAGR